MMAKKPTKDELAKESKTVKPLIPKEPEAPEVQITIDPAVLLPLLQVPGSLVLKVENLITNTKSANLNLSAWKAEALALIETIENCGLGRFEEIKKYVKNL